MTRTLIDLEGRRFGRWTVLGDHKTVRTQSGAKVSWLCVCDCGAHSRVLGCNLKGGISKSCGCLKDENQRNRIVHGHSRSAGESRTYACWRNMLGRCTKKNNKRYADYGGRGITVCDRWNDFKNFLADMGECPAGLTIEREDNNGHYCKANCRWATRNEQALNKRTNLPVTAFGQTKMLAEWTKELGLKYTTAWYRITHGWNPEEALRKSA